MSGEEAGVSIDGKAADDAQSEDSVEDAVIGTKHCGTPFIIAFLGKVLPDELGGAGLGVDLRTRETLAAGKKSGFGKKSGPGKNQDAGNQGGRQLVLLLQATAL